MDRKLGIILVLTFSLLSIVISVGGQCEHFFIVSHTNFANTVRNVSLNYHSHKSSWQTVDNVLVCAAINSFMIKFYSFVDSEEEISCSFNMETVQITDGYLRNQMKAYVKSCWTESSIPKEKTCPENRRGKNCQVGGF